MTPVTITVLRVKVLFNVTVHEIAKHLSLQMYWKNMQVSLNKDKTLLLHVHASILTNSPISPALCTPEAPSALSRM